MKIVCMVCPLGSPEIEEANYRTHMDTLHGGSQKAGRMINQNTPPLPNGVTPSDLPTPEFLETIQEMEAAKLAPKPPVAQPSVKLTPPTQKIEPIQLTYKYTGNCPTGHAVTTLEMDVEGKHFVVAYCLAESKQIESREVANLNYTKAFLVDKKTKEIVREIEVPIKTPSVVTKPSPLPPSVKARVNDKSQKDLTGGVPQKEVPIIAHKKK